MSGQKQTPRFTSYDIIIVGGAIMGSSTAWFLTQDPSFDGRVLVVEKDPSYANCSTAHTNSCMRQQFSNKLNVQISQFAADFVKSLPERIGDPRVPAQTIQNFGYLYLADNSAFAEVLRENQRVQRAAGAETELLNAAEIKARYPFYNVDDIVTGSINLKDEGYWDGGTVFDWWRRSAQGNGAEYVANEVVAITKNAAGSKVESVTLASGQIIACGHIVNASGPRASRTSEMAGISLPVEPRKRFTWIFSAARPLDRELPLTIDPSGVHFRQDGPETYLAGCAADPDPAVQFDDFHMDHDRWESHVWPVIASRIPQFEAIKVITEWAGHYAYNTFDHNAIMGPHDKLRNFIFLNGFSGHGLQQSPAMGRGTAEWLVHGAYQTLDLSPFNYERIPAGNPILEQAVI